MTATSSTVRTCPNCGHRFTLGAAPIISQEPMSTWHGHHADDVDEPDLDVDDAESLASEISSTGAVDVGDVVQSKVDRSTRMVLGRPPRRRWWSRREPPLLRPSLIATRFGYRDTVARRGCSRCWYPLPATIDTHDTPTAVLLGDRQSGKTAFVAALRAWAREFPQHQSQSHQLTFTREAIEILDDPDLTEAPTGVGAVPPTIQARYDAGMDLGRTQSERRVPLPLTAHRARPGRPSERLNVHLVDPSGEDVVRDGRRHRVLPVLEWASVMVLMVPPATDGEASAGALLEGVMKGLFASGTEDWPTLIVCASKVDLERGGRGANTLNRDALNCGPDQGDAPYNRQFLRNLVSQRDHAVVANADDWSGNVVWLAVAAMPSASQAAAVAGGSAGVGWSNDHEEEPLTTERLAPPWGMGPMVDAIVAALPRREELR
jgi:hypothetical protein